MQERFDNRDVGADSAAYGLANVFRAHFGHHEHLYAVLLDALADDLESGGPTMHICRDHLDDTRAEAIQLRLLAAIFRIVLRGDAPELVRFYPCLGGTASPEGAWVRLRPVFITHDEELHAALDTPPQTNEVGRSACLAIGLFEAVRRHGTTRVRLLEPGAAATSPPSTRPAPRAPAISPRSCGPSTWPDTNGWAQR